MKNYFSLIAVLMVVLLMAACSETTVEKVETETAAAEGEVTEEAATTEETEPAEEAAPEFFSVGDTVSVDGVNVTITSATFTEPAEYSEAANGKVLTMELAVENTNTESAFVDSTDFSLYDADGNQLNEYYGYDEMSISSDLNAGKKATGKLYFDVPEGTNYELIYTPFFSWDDVEVKWDIAVQ
ncbi:DUF4352 domain-containing protein [Jeotgalibacillus sp. R-1-5s-1]|uniref:DUF4352 domain-containing protein n=1 Tax=Jeotgalibacillus sp. R-1-5s-1 TaxID=2555897 RepID=UPI00106C5DC1|nr:DUF4352 domain-containing protein [Jeotgalibacillus sp. R-1-5s-1]TFD97056.1 DUF4352 domain-containing protein [Jeotgalibacillus sp. R-1-5s-1]